MNTRDIVSQAEICPTAADLRSAALSTLLEITKSGETQKLRSDASKAILQHLEAIYAPPEQPKAKSGLTAGFVTPRKKKGTEKEEMD